MERELNELEQDVVATRRHLRETWRALRAGVRGRQRKLHLKGRPDLYARYGHAAASHAGAKPASGSHPGRGSTALLIGAMLGLAFVVPRLLHRPNL